MIPELRRTTDDRKEHSIQIEVSEGALDMGPVECERDDGDRQVKSHADYITFLYERLCCSFNNFGISATGPKVGPIKSVGV